MGREVGKGEIESASIESGRCLFLPQSFKSSSSFYMAVHGEFPLQLMLIVVFWCLPIVT